MFIVDIFITFVYQPFFNILVLIYDGLKLITDNPDMGVALIIFTIILRIILYPLRKRNERTEEERAALAKGVVDIKKRYKGNPIEEKKRIKEIMKGNRIAVFSEILNITVQVSIALMLFKVFNTGLKGADFYLLYDFVPEVTEPFNLIFLDRFDLTIPNMTLNLVTSAVIFIAETMSLKLSLFPVSNNERLIFQLAVPIGAFIFFGFMPAGKKLFVIATLIISIILMGQKLLKEYWSETFNKKKKRLYIYH